MGLCIALEKENGQAIETLLDEKNLLHKLLPTENGESHSMLMFIDWYGNTVFNRLQMKRFLVEWASIVERAHTADEKSLVADIKALALRCEEGVHMYLKFIGD